jgi:hypothetical protein
LVLSMIQYLMTLLPTCLYIHMGTLSLQAGNQSNELTRYFGFVIFCCTCIDKSDIFICIIIFLWSQVTWSKILFYFPYIYISMLIFVMLNILFLSEFWPFIREKRIRTCMNIKFIGFRDFYITCFMIYYQSW